MTAMQDVCIQGLGGCCTGDVHSAMTHSIMSQMPMRTLCIIRRWHHMASTAATLFRRFHGG
jgi:hypothetical protein